MAAIPSYWYVEPDSRGSPFELLPDDVSIRPKPTDEGAGFWIDPATGEIKGEAVLMSRLPWPRFSSFFDAEKVVLPARQAETFERMADVLQAADSEAVPPHVCDKCGCWSLHFRVQVPEIEGEALRIIMDCHCQIPFRYFRRNPTAVGERR